MRFLLDAHLPKRLAEWLCSQGYDALHTQDLPAQNKTTDHEIIKAAIAQERIIVTKDEDFRNNFILRGTPPKLLLLTTGNTSNKVLLDLFKQNAGLIEKALLSNEVVELSKETLTVHF